MNNPEARLRKQFHLQLHQKEIKYLGVNLTREIEILYTLNYKKILKDMNKDLNK